MQNHHLPYLALLSLHNPLARAARALAGRRTLHSVAPRQGAGSASHRVNGYALMQAKQYLAQLRQQLDRSFQWRGSVLRVCFTLPGQVLTHAARAAASQLNSVTLWLNLAFSVALWPEGSEQLVCCKLMYS